MASFNSLDARKATFLLAPILIASPVAGLRPHASGSLSNLQYAEPSNSDSFAFLQVLGDQTDEVVQEFASRAFRQLMFFGQARGELGERNRNCACHAIPLDTRINVRCREEI